MRSVNRLGKQDGGAQDATPRPCRWSAGYPTWALCLLALVAPLGPLGWAVPAAPTALAHAATATIADAALAEVLPNDRAAVAPVAAELSAYAMTAAIDPATGTIAAEATVTYRNEAPEPLAEVWFRLFPNAAYYGDGGLTVGPVRADGQPAATELALEETALKVALPVPLAPGAAVELAFPFETTAPLDSTGSFGIFTRDGATGAWVLADWHPVLAVYEPGRGWNLPPVTPAGDPTFAPSALFDLRLTVPAGWAVAGSGVEVARTEAVGQVERRLVAGPARELTLVVDDSYVPSRATAGEVAVVAWSEPARAAAAARAAAVAAEALAAFGARFGPYPFKELELVQAPMGGALAVAWSSVLFLDAETLLGGWAEADPLAFETVVAHEVAHLWWGALVGADSNRRPFIQEGLATVSALGFVEWERDGEAALRSLGRWVLDPARELLGRGDAVVDEPVAPGQDLGLRSLAIYGKGSLGFLAIRQDIGDGPFWAALGDLAREHRFGIVEPADLLAAFEARSGQDLDDLWQTWFGAEALSAAAIEQIAGWYADPGR